MKFYKSCMKKTKYIELYQRYTPAFVKTIWRAYKKHKQWSNASVYSICKVADIADRVYHIKDESWERVYMPEIYKIMKSWENSSYHPAQDIYEIKNVDVRAASDIVTIGTSCIWDKSELDIFSKIIPIDNGLLEYKENKVWMCASKNINIVHGASVSLCGVHAKVWTHFLIQYLPNLYYAEEAGLLDKQDTVLLTPDYTDRNILEIINATLAAHPKVKRIICKDEFDTVYRCDTLYYMACSSIETNQAHYILPYDTVIPKRATDILRKKIVEPYTHKENDSNDKKIKLYIVRRSAFRGLLNYEEIEEFFKNEGFQLVEPHKLSMAEKAQLFRRAGIIAGPASGGWTNVIFCNGAKGLFLNTMSRTIDAYSKYLMQMGGVKVLQVTGMDYSTSSIHSDFYIPLEKIKKAYKYLLSNYD